MNKVENLDRVAVFGGAGNMGRLTVELFRNLNYPTVAVDPKDPDSLMPAEAIRSSRILFFSVLPVERIREIILDNEDLFDERHIVLDNATIKRPLRDVYQRLLARGVSICSTHPLCKHDQPLYGQKVLGMPVGDGVNSAEAKTIGDSIHENAGMELIEFDFDKHDQLMLAVQIPHIAQRVMGRTFEKMGVDVKFLQKIATANFQLYELSVWRTLIQDPQISAMIVANFHESPEGQEIIDKMRTSFEEIVGETDRNKLAASFQSTYDNLGGAEIGPVMNERTITVLERLANLARRSFTFVITDDKAGSLVRRLIPIARRRVSITAVDSHRSKEQTRFDIGIDPATSEEKLREVLLVLSKMGCTVIEKPH